MFIYSTEHDQHQSLVIKSHSKSNLFNMSWDEKGKIIECLNASSQIAFPMLQIQIKGNKGDGFISKDFFQTLSCLVQANDVPQMGELLNWRKDFWSDSNSRPLHSLATTFS